VDEIQKVPELFGYIKDIVDEKKTKGQFFLTGSQSIKLMERVSDSLAGRAGIIKMLGFSLRELAGIKHREPFTTKDEQTTAMMRAAPLLYYRDVDKNEIDLLISEGDYLYPVEIKASSDPNKSMVKAFHRLEAIPTKRVGQGAIICLSKERLPICKDVGRFQHK
jgi:predicted AAA+ superfamily ATPase